MNNKLMIISPYRDFGEMLKELSIDWVKDALIIDGEELNDRLRSQFDALLRDQVIPDAIIGRGVVTTYASKIFANSSIVRIDPNSIDILSPLKEARSYGDKVGIITYPNQGIEDNIDLLSEIYGYKEIKIYYFQNSDDIERQITCAKHDGMNSIIGGGTLGLQVAQAHNIPATFIKISKACLINAIEQAVAITESRRKEREQFGNIISVPSLRERRDDIEMLSNHFIDLYSKRYGKMTPRLAHSQIGMLRHRNWVGNVRELENLIHRYVILHNEIGDDALASESIGDGGIPENIGGESNDAVWVKKDSLENMERAIIQTFLRENQWNKQEVATKLGVSRSTLWRKLKDSQALNR